MNKHKSNKIKENSNTVRHLIMGQITTTQNLVAIKEVRHAGQICHPGRWNIKRTKRKGTRPENKRKNNYRLTPMDGRCMPDPPWPRNPTNMLDVTNHVALKYHIQFGAAKCKVIRKGKGRKSNLKLNGEVLEEVATYKYLGEIINNKGNLTYHINEIEKKIRGATSKILAETGNKEFKGIKMKAIWQMVDAIITYACEVWYLNKEDKKKLQTIFNEAQKKSSTYRTAYQQWYCW